MQMGHLVFDTYLFYTRCVTDFIEFAPLKATEDLVVQKFKFLDLKGNIINALGALFIAAYYGYWSKVAFEQNQYYFMGNGPATVIVSLLQAWLEFNGQSLNNLAF